MTIKAPVHSRTREGWTSNHTYIFYVDSTFGVKLSNRKNTCEHVDKLGLKGNLKVQGLKKVVKRSEMRWMDHTLRKEDDNELSVNKSMGSRSKWHERNRKAADCMERHGEEREW